MGILCRGYTLAPSVAWNELGRPALGPRGRMRLARAVSELQFIDHALEEVTRQRGDKEGPPSVAEVLAVEEIAMLYAADLEASMEDDAGADAGGDGGDPTPQVTPQATQEVTPNV